MRLYFLILTVNALAFWGEKLARNEVDHRMEHFLKDYSRSRPSSLCDRTLKLMKNLLRGFSRREIQKKYPTLFKYCFNKK